MVSSVQEVKASQVVVIVKLKYYVRTLWLKYYILVYIESKPYIEVVT